MLKVSSLGTTSYTASFNGEQIAKKRNVESLAVAVFQELPEVVEHYVVSNQGIDIDLSTQEAHDFKEMLTSLHIKENGSDFYEQEDE